MSEPLTRAAVPSPAPLRSAALDAEDRMILDQVELYLERGRALKRWWDQRGENGHFEDRFELAYTYNRPDTSFGFFATADVDGAPMPILGNHQGMFYDQPKSGVEAGSRGAEHINREIQEFVLRYFMRVADFREPQPYTEGEPAPPPLLGPLSWCFRDDVQVQGFGYTQLYYKLRDTGEMGKFPEARRRAIVDLRDIGRTFDWIVVRVRIFDFKFVFAPFGSSAPSATLPLEEASLLVLAPPFILDEDHPQPHAASHPAAGELGHYGLGYAFLKNPTKTLLAWGPGKFDAAYQTIDFHVMADGRIRVGMVFVANRPTRIMNLPVDPFRAGVEMVDMMLPPRYSALTAPARMLAAATPWSGLTFDPVFPSIAALNLATGGLAGRELCLTRKQLEKRLILTHFDKHYGAVLGSLQTWRQVRDWLDPRTLPRWVITGESA
jgi:hypothetical protein